MRTDNTCSFRFSLSKDTGFILEEKALFLSLKTEALALRPPAGPCWIDFRLYSWVNFIYLLFCFSLPGWLSETSLSLLDLHMCTFVIYTNRET